MNESGRLVASICHGPWIDISARIVKGFRYTSTPGIKDDLVNAGATWVDEPLVIDRNHVTSRRPDDLPRFLEGILQVLGE
jgi:protease I